VLSDLDVIFNEIHLPRSKLSFFGKLFGASTSLMAKQGAYVYGDVGSGKTMLMDLFFESSSISAKHRVHYNQFMNDIHKGTLHYSFHSCIL
jgi:cell division protein ZapE